MGRKRIGEGVLIILFFLPIVCGVQKRTSAEQVIDRIIESVNAESMEEATAFAPEQAAEQITDLDGEFKQILSLADSKLLGGYSIDESFLMWFVSRFGEEPLKNIARRIAEGETDPSMWYEETSNSIHVLWMQYCRDLGYATYQLDHVVWKEADTSDAIRIDFIGDINFDRDWYTMREASEHVNGAAGCIDDKIQQELSGADITLVNNEFPYSLEGEPLAGKAYTFRADPMSVSLLGMFGTDIVSLANNHVWDYGQEALLDTLETLEESGISYIGAGRNLSEAEQVCYYIINGRKIAFVSATQIEKNYNYTQEATADSPGVLKTLDPEKFLAVIAEAKQNSDYVIAYVHWGTEGVLYPEEDQRSLASSFVEAGADLIVGDHSHRLQGIYYIDGVPVINSLGNFWFSTGSLYTTVLQMTIDTQGDISIGLLPCIQEDLNVSLLYEDADAADFYQYIADLSENISIGADGVIHEGIFPDLYQYQSGMYYQSRNGSYDLNGRAIDIVGNLQ
jgi:poly-gamma-glutamate synthesis protein (capsule biosynthesis protein)